MRSHLLVFAALGLAIVGCSKEPEKTAWNCQQLGVPGGETLSCTKQAVTTDGTSSSINSDGYVPPMPTGLDEETCEGSLDDPDTCTSDGLATGGGAGGSATNTGSTDSTSSTGTSGGGGGGSIYFCVAGSADCPPVSAVVGLNSDAASAAGSTGGGAGSTGGSGAGGGDSTAPVGSDSTDSKGEESGGGGGRGDGDKEGDKDDAKAGEGGGAGSGPGGSSVGTDGTSSTGTGGKGSGSGGAESYRCEKKKNGRIDCTKTEPKCEEGLTPTGGYCSTGGTSDGASSSGPTTSGADGSSTTSSSTPKTTTSNGKSVGLKEVTTHPDGTKTWTYEVCEVSGQDLSNWVLGTGSCQIVSSSPNQGFEKVSPDPNSGITGVKWNTGGHSGCQTYSVTTKGGTESMISVSTKAPGVAYGVVAGPVCN